MGLFSRSESMSSKAKIDELKKKIAQDGGVKAPSVPTAVPTQQQTAPAQQQVVSQVEPVAQAVPPPQMEQFAAQQMEQIDRQVQQVNAQPVSQNIDLDHHFQEKEVSEVADGVVLDLGNGMSLNLPIRPRMKLEEFLAIADKVKELKKLNYN